MLLTESQCTKCLGEINVKLKCHKVCHVESLTFVARRRKVIHEVTKEVIQLHRK